MSAAPGLLERYRAFQTTRAAREGIPAWGSIEERPRRPSGGRQRAELLAELLDGTVVDVDDGAVVRLDAPALPLAVDRWALAALPFATDPQLPFVCLDTETTGLATSAGTVVFLVGLGRWDGALFRVTQLLLPDHADEDGFLTLLATELGANSCLVTYNGRSFDWPLLETRFRLRRRIPPPIAGHLDLLPVARLLFRHRLPDARLCSVESGVCGVERVDDLPGALAPERYLAYLRYGDPGYLHDVVRHNEHDVRSLARLLAHLAERLAEPSGRAQADPGDVGRLARAYARQGRHEEALACFDAAVSGLVDRARERAWFGAERARLLRRMGRHEDAFAAWEELARAGSRAGARAWIEMAKHHEHRRGDAAAALAACDQADALVARARLGGRIPAGLEVDLTRRRARLRARLNRSARGAAGPRGASGSP